MSQQEIHEKDPPGIAIIILQYGQWNMTAQCVKSLLAGALRPRWVIVVDNASPDDSCRRIQDYLAGCQSGSGSFAAMTEKDIERAGSAGSVFTLIKMESNRGYAAGNNAGLRLSMKYGADAFLILNNDTAVAPNALHAMWERLQRSSRPGLCGAMLVYPQDNWSVQCCAGGHTNYISGLSTFAGAGLSLDQARGLDPETVEKKLNFICGACVLASRSFVEEVGLMDEGYFLYCEEQDWALRANGRFSLVYAPEALVFHHEGASTGWSRYSFRWKIALMLMRSRLRLSWRYHPQYLPCVAVCFCVAAARLLARGAIARIVDFCQRIIAFRF